MITVDQLRKLFADKKRGQVVAVDSLSFSVKPGEIYGLLGPNGAGKTTALRMIATLLKPTAGKATVAGFDTVSHSSDVRRHIGFLAASTALYGRLTARETVTYFGELNDLPAARIRSQLELLVTELDMGDFLDRRVDTFSTGMKQKTSIARTLVHDPDVIILDEPTLGLDVMSARAIIAFVRRCRERGKTVIYSTHHMHEVERLCDRVGIIHESKLVCEGTVAELKTRYRSENLEDVFVLATGLEPSKP
ncbi:MAG: ATP-binding cassette domain-containing protein [Opitutaceae bacterium]|nr:ATP-binding cassette domain-containing protein [Opitutaceae bacterium]